MVFAYLILTGIDVVVLIRLFLLSFVLVEKMGVLVFNCIKRRRPHSITFPTPQLLPNIFRWVLIF